MSKVLIYTQDNGVAAVVFPIYDIKEEQSEDDFLKIVAKKSIPSNVEYQIIDIDSLPQDQMFRDAWTCNDGIVVDIDKSKIISHVKRRAMRSAEFAPYDEIISKQIPGNDAVQAEVQRQLIRNKYAKMQNDIDNATTPEQLVSILTFS